MKKVKIRIVEPPMMAYGGQTGYGLNLNARRTYVEGAEGPQDNYASTLGPVDREDATYEAEQGEVIVGDMDRDGRKESLTFGGKPHSQGGTPANQDGFIFSKTKSMALRGPILEKFGKKPGTKHTIADLAKQYNLTKVKAVLDDPNADELTKKTAKLQYDQYESKLADLAMVQESMKGFPQGVPDIAAKKYGRTPMGTEVAAGPMAAYGGMYKMQMAGETPRRFSINNLPKINVPELELLKKFRNSGTAEDLQRLYDSVRSRLGLRAFFNNNQAEQAAASTPAPEAAPQEQEITLDNYQMQQGEDPNFVSPSGSRLPYNRMDVLNLLTAASTPVKSFFPRMFQPDVQEMQGVYDQPDFNPLLAAANTRAQMNQTFGNASAAMSANSYNPELMQGLIQETQRARANNLQTANNVSQANTQIRNQANMINAQLAQDNYDKYIRTLEQADIANRLKLRRDVIPAAQNMVNNRINMERFNALYPQYQVTGPDWRVNFDAGKNYGARAGATTGLNYGLNEFFAENPDLKAIYDRGDDAKKLEIAKMVAARQREIRTMMGRSPANISGNINNPMFFPMMGMPPVGPMGVGDFDFYE